MAKIGMSAQRSSEALSISAGREWLACRSRQRLNENEMYRDIEIIAIEMLMPRLSYTPALMIMVSAYAVS